MSITIDDHELRDKINKFLELQKLFKKMAMLFSERLVTTVNVRTIRSTNLDNWAIVAIDGSIYREEQSLITSVITSSYAYVYIGGNRGVNVPVMHPSITLDLFPPSYATLAGTLKMKFEERKRAIKVINVLEKHYSIDPEKIVLLIDGSLTFPETLPALPQEVEKLYKNYIMISEKLFKLIKEKNVKLIAISKDPVTAKFLRSLIRIGKKIHKSNTLVEIINALEMNDETMKEIITFYNTSLNLWEKHHLPIPERILIERAFLYKIKSMTPEKLRNIAILRTLTTETTLGLRDEKIDISTLQGNVLGFYCAKPSVSLKPLLVEFPSWINKDEIITLATSLIYKSPTGYPIPLIMAHKMVKLTAARAKILIREQKNRLLHEIKNTDWWILFERRFREEPYF